MHAGIAGGAAPPRGGVDHTLDQICLEKDNLLKCFLNLFVIIIIVVFVVAFIIISIVTWGVWCNVSGRWRSVLQ